MILEDFTTYTEVDTIDDRIQKTANHCDHYSHGNEDTYLYKDKTADHFTDFDHKVDVRSDFNEINARGSFWVLANDLDDFYRLQIDGKTALGVQSYYRAIGPERWISLREVHAGNGYGDHFITAAVNTWYYLRIVKSGTTFVCGIYSTAELRDAGDGTDGDVDNLALTLHADHSFQYVYACSSHDSDINYFLNNDTANLDLQEEVAPTESLRISREFQIGDIG